MIRLKHVSKTFDSRTGNMYIVQGVALAIQDKETYGIIGFNGTGKSTLVCCINLLERSSRGAVAVDNQDITRIKGEELRTMREKIGMIFQHFSLMRGRTVYQNIVFPLKGSELSKAEMDQKICRLLKLVDLSDKIDAYPSQLSDGQKQHVAVTRALANDFKVLLCDEATSALDSQATKSILKLLKKVNEELGIAIVLTAHEVAVIKEICNRVAVMEDEYVVGEGSIIDIFSKPQAGVTHNFITSTSNAHRVREMLDTGASVTRLEKGQRTVRLNYDPISTSKTLISGISRRFLVDANIIFGSVEIIKNAPLDDLIVILSEEEAHIDQALAYLKVHEVGVEVMKSY